jgi:multidrug efflux pump subunit AcrB
MNRKISLIEKFVAGLPPSELDNFISRAGIMSENPMDPNEKIGTNYGTIIVNLTPEEDRKRKAEKIIDGLREDGKSIQKEFVSLEFSFVRHGPPVGKAVNVTIKGDNFKTLLEVAEKYKGYLKEIADTYATIDKKKDLTIPALKDIKDNFEEGKREQKIFVNEKVAAIAGISVFDVATTVRACYKGAVATKIKKTDEEIDIRVVFPESYRMKLTSLNHISITNKIGNLVPLKNIASFKSARGISEINRQAWKRAVKVTADIDEHAKDVTSVYVNGLLMDKFKNIGSEYPGIFIDYLGEFKDTQESMQNLAKSFLIAIFIIYIILVALFRSLMHPFIVMNIIPLTFIGVVWSFFFHNMPLSFLASMGIVGLAGVVVNDSIVLIDFMKNAQATGLSPLEASIQACAKRLRPVFLTTITTFFGLLPTAYGIGGNDPFLKPMAISLSWGLAFGSFITLFATPILYNMFADLRKKILGEYAPVPAP